jgi:hypothetical protein
MADKTEDVSEEIRVFMAERLAPTQILLDSLQKLTEYDDVDWDQVEEEVLAAGDRLAESLLGEIKDKLEVDEDGE